MLNYLAMLKLRLYVSMKYMAEKSGILLVKLAQEICDFVFLISFDLCIVAWAVCWYYSSFDGWS